MQVCGDRIAADIDLRIIAEIENMIFHQKGKKPEGVLNVSNIFSTISKNSFHQNLPALVLLSPILNVGQLNKAHHHFVKYFHQQLN